MIKKLCLVFLTLIMVVSMVSVPMLATAASVEDQLTEEQVEATPLVDEDGNEIAFEVKGDAAGNSGGAIFIMVAVVLVGAWLIVDGIVSYIRRAKKESKNRFKNMND